MRDSLIINQSPIQMVQSIKYLGLFLDTKLSFSCHIDHLCKKLSHVQGILFSLRRYLPTQALKSIYYSLAYSNLLLHCVLWGSAPKTSLSKLQVAQNKILRNIVTNSYEIHTNQLFTNLNIININNLIDTQTLYFFYGWAFQNRYHFLLTQYQQVLFDHDHNTRNHRLRIPYSRTEVQRRSPLNRAINLWNELPNHIKEGESFSYFKNNCLRYLLERRI